MSQTVEIEANVRGGGGWGWGGKTGRNGKWERLQDCSQEPCCVTRLFFLFHDPKINKTDSGDALTYRPDDWAGRFK